MTENVVTGIAGAGLVLMSVSITADALSRYLLGASLPGTMKITELFLMPAIIFLSWGVAQRHRKHVAVDILHGRLRSRVAAVVDRLIDLLGLVLFVLVLITAWQVTSQQWGLWTVEKPPLPTGPSRAIVVVGASLMCLRLVVQLVRGRSRTAESESPGGEHGTESG